MKPLTRAVLRGGLLAGSGDPVFALSSLRRGGSRR